MLKKVDKGVRKQMNESSEFIIHITCIVRDLFWNNQTWKI